MNLFYCITVYVLLLYIEVVQNRTPMTEVVGVAAVVAAVPDGAKVDISFILFVGFRCGFSYFLQHSFLNCCCLGVVDFVNHRYVQVSLYEYVKK